MVNAIEKVREMGILLAKDHEANPYTNLLNFKKLDFSVKSLEEVDRYLNSVRKKKLTEDEIKKIVLRCGTYLGEVIIRNKPNDFKWITRDEAKLPGFIANDLTTAFVLLKKSKEMLFPLAKAYKFIENGKDDSLWIFGMYALDMPSKRVAILQLKPVKKTKKKKVAQKSKRSAQ
ncbi:MAG: hypothetical protein ACP5N7_06950 [Candidatus Pacearchaeota archaeon]